MPNFSSKNPADSIFWNDRFAEDYMPWDGAGVPTELQEFVGRQSTTSYSCLIPGCGIGYEVKYLVERGWDVQAIDFAPAAVDKAQLFLGPLAHHVKQADFFNFQPQTSINCIYERAFFCALPLHLRASIVERWAQLLPKNGLLIGYFYLENNSLSELGEIKGPPYLTSRTQLSLLLDKHFECVEMHAAQASIAIFSGREYWMVWRKK